MSKAELMEVTEALVQQLQDRGIEDRVNISLVKEAGSYSCKRHLDASSPAAAINALGMLILDLAKDLQVPAVHIMSILAVIIMGPSKEEQRDGKADG